jgi:hypothetical protein
MQCPGLAANRIKRKAAAIANSKIVGENNQDNKGASSSKVKKTKLSQPKDSDASPQVNETMESEPSDPVGSQLLENLAENESDVSDEMGEREFMSTEGIYFH